MRPLVLMALAAWPLAAQVPLEWDATSPNGAQIAAYLQRKNSAMAGIGATLEDLARQYNLDPRLIVAIAGAETTFGKHVCAVNNAWN
jgi:membrane-bound lytic murein transglycosylase B